MMRFAKSATIKCLLLAFLTTGLAASFAFMSIRPAVATSVDPTCTDDTCGDGGGWGQDGDVLTTSGDWYTGAELDDGFCSSTTMELDFQPQSFGEGEGTYLFQVTDAAGNLVEQQTGALSDLDVRGSFSNGAVISFTSAQAVPNGGAISMGIFVNGSDGEHSAGAMYSNFMSGC